MKRKILLKNKKRYKRTRRYLKKLQRNITSYLKFGRYGRRKFYPIISDCFMTNLGGKLQLRDSNSNVYMIPVNGDYKPIEFDYGPMNDMKMRCPNEREIIHERIDILRKLYMSGEMCRNAYYTLKGLARKDPVNAENFIKKHSILGYTQLQLFKTTESILVASASVKFARPVEIYTIDLNLKEEN